MKTLFLISFFILISVYIIFPAVLLFFNKIRSGSKQHSKSFLPTVSLITSLCKEPDEIVKQTYRNRLLIEYPSEKLELVFIIDGASENIKNILKPLEGKKFIIYETGAKGGKTKALNDVIPQLKSDIVVFSDANSNYRADAVLKLVRHFSDETIGGVCGELQYVNEDAADMAGKVSNVYFRYEQVVKMAESTLSTLTVFNGAIYAIRRKLHQEMNPQAANDFQHPMQIILQGYRSIYELEGIAYEQAVKDL